MKDSKLIELKLNISDAILRASKALEPEAKTCLAQLFTGELDMTGWARVLENISSELIEDIEKTAINIRSKSSVFVVIGIGGSYLGTKAADDFLLSTSANAGNLGAPVLAYAGFNLSGSYHKKLYDYLQDKDFCICHFSKSGTTVEPSLAYAQLKEMLFSKYGKDAKSRIFAVTDESRGVLREEVNREGYKAFTIPDDFGGRYSVISPIGLLPMAVAGIDIRAVLKGVKQAKEGLLDTAIQLATVRKALADSGKTIEAIGLFEPSLFYFSQWMVQLYGESEGKGGKGVWPSALSFSTDLHSMGQFLQEGNQCFYETILEVKSPKDDVVIRAAASPYDCASVNAYNEAARGGMVAAHRSIDIPILEIIIPRQDEESFGQLVYMLEITCALTGLMMGVDPFNQPGVEVYKSEMKGILCQS